MSLELKNIVEDLGKTFAEFKDVNESRLVEIQKLGQETAETKARFDKFQNRMDELEADFKRASQAKEVEVKGGMSKEDAREAELFTKAMFRKGLNRAESAEWEAIQSKAMRTDIAVDGGVLSPMNYEQSVIDLIVEASPVMRLARNFTISQGDSLTVPIKSANAALGGWVSEVTAPSETNNPKLANTVVIPTHELFAEPQISRQMIEDSMINVESFVQLDVAQIFDQKANEAFVSGDGSGKPQGFLNGLPAGSLFNFASATALTSDEILRGMHKLKSGYSRRATWGMSRQTIGYTRTLKATSSADNYLWQPGLANGAPATFLGRPYEEFPDLAAPADNGNYTTKDNVMVLADWQNFYGVVRKLGLVILKDEYTNKPFVKYYHRMRIGGARLQSEAGIVFRTA